MATDADPVTTAPLAPGREIDGFRLLGKVHDGGTAVLFEVEAVDGTQHGFPLLMKIPTLDRDEAMESIIAFETEAMILPILRGPYVPRFVAVGEISSVPHLTMEKVQGTGLVTIADTAPLAADRVATLGAALADAVHALHQQNVIHHDLKPDNVIVRDDGSVVLLDFGFAHHAHFPDLLAEEQRFTAGSAPYVSPEQLTGSREDPRSDLFALGAVLYELATGWLPFGVPLTLKATRDRLWAPPVPPRARVADIPAWLQEVILRCLEPEPAARYQSAAHVALDLRNSEQVLLSPRSTLTSRPGFMTQFGLWWRSRDERRQLRNKPKVLVSQAPVIMVAIDTSRPDNERYAALQWKVRQQITVNLEFRLICIAAVRVAPVVDKSKPEAASPSQLEHLVRLRNWVEPLGLEKHRVSLHVLESTDPATTLLEFARHNNVDLIVIGAPGTNDAAPPGWRSPASIVSDNAHCSVLLAK